MANFVYIAASLDGFIAREDGGLDWLTDIPNPEGSDYGFVDFINSVDAVVMGRSTYEVVLKFGEWSYTKPVFVLSSRLTQIDERLEGKAELMTGEPEDIVMQLQKRGYWNLYIDGGKVIQSFLREDLIDEMVITRVSILLGSGIPLFGTNDPPRKFSHMDTEILNDDLVKSRYIRIRT